MNDRIVSIKHELLPAHSPERDFECFWSALVFEIDEFRQLHASEPQDVSEVACDLDDAKFVSPNNRQLYIVEKDEKEEYQPQFEVYFGHSLLPDQVVRFEGGSRAVLSARRPEDVRTLAGLVQAVSAINTEARLAKTGRKL